MKTNPITDQIVGTLGNMRREVTTQGITAEADMLWQHALSLYKMRRERERAGDVPDPWARMIPWGVSCSAPPALVIGMCPECGLINRHEEICSRRLPAFLRKQAE